MRRRERITVFNQLIQHEESIHVQCGYVYDLSWGSYAFRRDVYHHNAAVSHPFACETDTAWCWWSLCKALNKRFSMILGSVCVIKFREKCENLRWIWAIQKFEESISKYLKVSQNTAMRIIYETGVLTKQRSFELISLALFQLKILRSWDLLSFRELCLKIFGIYQKYWLNWRLLLGNRANCYFKVAKLRLLHSHARNAARRHQDKPNNCSVVVWPSSTYCLHGNRIQTDSFFLRDFESGRKRGGLRVRLNPFEWINNVVGNTCRFFRGSHSWGWENHNKTLFKSSN